MRRDDLVRRYFADEDDCHNRIHTHRGGTRAELIVDGAEYFKRVWSTIEQVGPGDLVFFVGWIIDVDLAIGGRKLGDLLFDKALAGADVRLVLNGGLYLLNWTPSPSEGNPSPFERSHVAAANLRARERNGQRPLEAAVLQDLSGIAVTRSQHQKSFLVHRAGTTTAWVGGIDPWPNRNDSSEHSARHPWHDMAIELEGAATIDVWSNFVCRWNEASTLLAALLGPGLNPLVSKPLLEPPTAAQVPPVPGHDNLAVQILRSRFPWKAEISLTVNLDFGGSVGAGPIRVPGLVPPPSPRTALPWSYPPRGGIREVHATLVKAIGAAQNYIYFEDQFGGDNFTGEVGPSAYSLFGDHGPLAERVRANVKLIVLLPGANDDGSLLPAKLSSDLRTLLLSLPPAMRRNVAVWQLVGVKVHTKMAFIDDEFCAVGSANMQTRSMYGVDYELHTAVVDADKQIRDWRLRVWAEHLDVLPLLANPTGNLIDALETITLARGLWNQDWLPADRRGMWLTPDNPPGFRPQRQRLKLIFGGAMEVPDP